MAIEVKTSHNELLECALTAQAETGGGPVEVSEGNKKIKLGAWMGKEFTREAIGLVVMVRLAMEEYTAKSTRKAGN